MYKVLSILSSCGAGIISISLISSQASANTYAKTSGLTPEVEVSNTVREEVKEIERDFETLEVVEKMSDIEYLIRTKAREVGFDEDLLVRISFCESGHDPKIKNQQGSSASGLFQITKATQIDAEKVLGKKDVFDAEDNIDMALYFLLKGQLGRWSESKHCWG